MSAPYPIDELRSIPTWQLVMDDDFDSASACILVADHPFFRKLKLSAQIDFAILENGGILKLE